MKLSMKEYSIISILEKNSEMTFKDIDISFKDSSASIRSALKSLISKEIVTAVNIGKNNYKYKLFHIYQKSKTEDLIYIDTQKILKFLSSFQEFENEEDEENLLEKTNNVDDFIENNDKLDTTNVSVDLTKDIQIEKEEVITSKVELPEDHILASNEILNYYINKSGKTIKNRDFLIEIILPFLNNKYKKDEIKEVIDSYIKEFDNHRKSWNLVSTPETFFSKILLDLL